ncbi:putative membrane protein [Chitinophaga dinghuensis]|uniref:Putative membrane protein n=1 Tax=Chitinophaga dinghuensis TaxID=1539050 RepID=A0A327VYH4_9BACT|nr:TMEM175 family protein [Chitinophaga dinghuensis]RAJ80403.1 putative membrane protein [Chitinophaga dinghuensis]
MEEHKKSLSNINNRISEKTRIEAISDGTFAIIITLLVLEIHRPAAIEGTMGHELLKNWPSYLAYAVAFIYVGVIWLNHHYMFLRLKETDPTFNWMNLGVLGASSLIPFPTGVLADAFKTGNLEDQKASIVLYAVIGGLMTLSWVPPCLYLSKKTNLLKDEVAPDTFKGDVKRPLTGTVFYIIGGLFGWFIHPAIAVFIFTLLILFYAWNSQGLNPQFKKIMTFKNERKTRKHTAS